MDTQQDLGADREKGCDTLSYSLQRILVSLRHRELVKILCGTHTGELVGIRLAPISGTHLRGRTKGDEGSAYRTEGSTCFHVIKNRHAALFSSVSCGSSVSTSQRTRGRTAYGDLRARN